MFKYLKKYLFHISLRASFTLHNWIKSECTFIKLSDAPCNFRHFGLMLYHHLIPVDERLGEKNK